MTRESARVAASKKQRQIYCNIVLLRNDVRHYIPKKYIEQCDLENLINVLSGAIDRAIYTEEADASAPTAG